MVFFLFYLFGFCFFEEDTEPIGDGAMESTVGERRLPSLDDLLESEVILGDDDESDLSDTSDLASSVLSFHCQFLFSFTEFYWVSPS